MSDAAKTLEGPERLIGSRVLDFELKAVIGAGGMSVVYRGEHRVTQQEVAIKSLGKFLANLPGIGGSTIMGDGRVALIVDPMGLIGDGESAGARISV